MWLVYIKRSFQGLSVAIETVRINEELMEIWPNEVCDIGPEGSTLRSRKGFSLISEGEPSISYTKPKVSDSRFGSTAYIPVLLRLLCKSCSGSLTGDAKLACCTIEVCWLLVLCSRLDSTLEIDMKFKILKNVKERWKQQNQWEYPQTWNSPQGGLCKGTLSEAPVTLQYSREGVLSRSDG